jgi:xanthine dehydrogenase small subunit
MNRSLNFILNGRFVSTELPAGTLTLDYLRRERRLTGTKEGCREGDCGACAVLLGQLPRDSGRTGGRQLSETGLYYSTVNSCLLPVGELEGRHLVTIEGLNPQPGEGEAASSLPPLNPVQQCFLEEGASQCGFCTPGFVISLTGYLLRSPAPTLEGALEAVAGNICRCTGYASIRRAVGRLLELVGSGGPEPVTLARLCELGVVPGYFQEIPEALRKIVRGGFAARAAAYRQPAAPKGESRAVLVAGGTDLFVQRPEELESSRLQFLSRRTELSGMWREDGRLVVGAAATMEELHALPELAATLAPVADALQWVASSPIRQRASLGGNLVNASPIGDLTILLLALGACLGLRSGDAERELPLEEFYRGYKQLDLGPREVVVWVAFAPPEAGSYLGFEKVARRRHLDIASVNSAAWLKAEAAEAGGAGSRRLTGARISAGGVAPVPLFLARTSAHLEGRQVEPKLFREALEVAQEEAAPIDDVRGSAAYKRLALRQLLIAHFLGAFPEELCGEEWR